jgi:hypothetical protein
LGLALLKKQMSSAIDAEQVIGREGETATLLSGCPLNLSGLSAVSPYVNSVVSRLIAQRMKGLLQGGLTEGNPLTYKTCCSQVQEKLYEL